MALILVIGDSVPMLHAIEGTLRDTGHTVITAACGERGVEILRRQSIDLLITEMVMPDRDGIEILGDARRWPPGRGIVAITERLAGIDLGIIARRLGASAILHKSFSMDSLKATVNTLLDGASRTRTEPDSRVQPAGEEVAPRFCTGVAL